MIYQSHVNINNWMTQHLVSFYILLITVKQPNYFQIVKYLWAYINSGMNANFNKTEEMILNEAVT